MKPLTPSEIETIRVPGPTVDPFSLDSLIAWLETMPADATYNFADCSGRCLLHQYADAVGIPKSENRYTALNAAFDNGPCQYFIAVQGPHTFGAALDRARSARAVEQAND